MSDRLANACTAFDGERRLAAGPLIEVALAVKAATAAGAEGPLLAFDDATGGLVDLDLRGSRAEIAARLAAAAGEAAPPPQGRGRPSLGVVAREVTLLPRHWEWLAAQSGGASAAIRRLIDEARRAGGAKQQMRAAQDAAFKFMTTMAGDLPGYEEATRALYAKDRQRFARHIAVWPDDVRAYATTLAEAALA
jgi:hypothetical protein